MKYCSKCGEPLNNDTQKFCMKCGWAFQKNGEGNYYRRDEISLYPMKAFKFLIWFGLFFSAIISFSNGMMMVSGIVYDMSSNFEVTSEMVYELYGTALQILDILYGGALLGIAVFAVITRFKLSNFKKEGPKFLYLLYILNVVLGLVYIVGAVVVTGNAELIAENAADTVGQFIASIVALLCWKKYFSKRKLLFCN